MRTGTSSYWTGWNVVDVVIIAGLVGLGIDYLLPQLAGIIPALLVFAFIYLAVAGVVATRWRWAALVSGVVAPVITGLVLAHGEAVYFLTHPQAYGSFVSEVFFVALNVLVTGASALKVWQLLRPSDQPDLGWLTPTLTGLAGVVLGALIIGAIAAPTPAATASKTAVVHAELASFAPDIVALHTGDTLTIVTDSSVQHILLNGTWNGNRPMPSRESGAPAVNNVHIQGNTVHIGPFATAGTFHLYCTIHPGMVLTVVVAP